MKRLYFLYASLVLFSCSNKNDDIFDENVRDDANRHFIILKEKLFILGYKLTTLDNKDIDDADFILSYDKHLLKINNFRGIKIVKPEELII